MKIQVDTAFSSAGFWWTQQSGEAKLHIKGSEDLVVNQPLIMVRRHLSANNKTEIMYAEEQRPLDTVVFLCATAKV